MKKEDYVSLEVAKLLEEKGYDEPCSSRYIVAEDGRCEFERVNTFDIKKSMDLGEIKDGYLFDSYLAPSLYDVQQWLWQKHKLLVTAFLEAPFGKPYEFIYCIQDAKNSVDDNGSVISEQSFDSIQKALNEGILEALKTIDDGKEITKKD